MEFKDLLIKYREKSGLNKTELAKKLDLSASYIMMLESGHRKPPAPARVKQISNILSITGRDAYLFQKMAIDERMRPDDKAAYEKITSEETHTKSDPQSPIQRIPIISWVHANKFEEIHDPFPAGISDDYTYTEVKGKNIFALRIANDCMYPKFNEGDIIVINPHDRVAPGDYIVVADREENTATFKQLKKYGTKLYLHPLNPKYEDIEMDHKKQYTIIGKAIERLAREKL